MIRTGGRKDSGCVTTDGKRLGKRERGVFLLGTVLTSWKKR